jgi:CRP/FNR family transcriptional regulator, cyclic AMP receptor protein
MNPKLSEKKDPELVRILRNVPIFYNLNEDSIKTLLEIASETTFAPGRVIVKEGSRDDTLHVILNGQVEVRKNGRPIASLGTGQFFGEMAFLDDLPSERSADVVTVEETRSLSIPGWSWYSFLRKNPDVAIEVIRTLAHRLREANEALTD